MSRFAAITLPCACGHGQPARVAESINVTRTPAARAEILAGTLHCFECAQCGAALVHRGPWLYTDVDRRQMISVRLPEEADDWAGWEVVAERAFWKQYPRGGESWRADADDYRLRLVFGQWALREKLLLWDAGLDDAMVEIIKLDLRLRHGLGGLPIVVAVTASDLVLRVVGSDDEVRVDRAAVGALDLRLIQRRYPGLRERLFVDHRRVAFDGVLETCDETAALDQTAPLEETAR